jgi:hypothetical protein
MVTCMAETEGARTSSSTPSFVRDLPSGAQPVSDPLELDSDTLRDLADQVREIEASRAAAAVSGRDYIIR